MGRTQDRTWRIEPDPDTGVVDPGEVVAAFQEAAIIMLRLGGGVVAVPERFQHPRTREWLTRAVQFKWTSFVPPVEPPRYEEPEPELPGIEEDTLAALEGEEPDMRDEDEAEVAAALAREPEVVLE